MHKWKLKDGSFIPIKKMDYEQLKDAVNWMQNAWHRYDHQGIDSKLIPYSSEIKNSYDSDLDFFEIDGFYDKFKYSNIREMFPNYVYMKTLLNEKECDYETN